MNDVFNGKTILLTGSNGFVGRNLIEVLIKYNCKIVGIGRNKTNKNPSISYFSCDLRDKNLLKNIINEIKPNYIFNLAAIVTAKRDYSLYEDMIDLHCKSLYFFYDILSCEKYFDLFINFGTCEEYGDYQGLPFEENFFERSNSPYAASKTAGIRFTRMIGKNEKFPIISIRPSVIFGKYQNESKFTQYVINNLKNNRPLNLTKCEQTRDFIYVEKFINYLLELIKSKNYNFGEIYNVASGKSIRLKDFVKLAKVLLNSNSKINFGIKKYRDNEIMQFNVSIDKIEKSLNKKIIINFEDDLKQYLKNC